MAGSDSWDTTATTFITVFLRIGISPAKSWGSFGNCCGRAGLELAGHAAQDCRFHGIAWTEDGTEH